MLSQPARLFWLLVNLTGQVPAFLFWIWVERNASLPYLPIELHWPWVDFGSWTTVPRAAFDFALFLSFGVLHSVIAQKPIQRLIGKLVAPQAIRTFYIFITGACLLCVMALWQHTGIVLWVAPLPTVGLQVLSVVAFWSMMIVPFFIVSQFDTLEFAGVRQLYQKTSALERTEGNAKLIDTGIYGWVRHPIYLFTLLAFFLAPMMTLDRLLVALAMIVYLSFGVPMEEKKLVKLFGAAYQDYQRRVPAVIPLLTFRSRARGSSSS